MDESEAKLTIRLDLLASIKECHSFVSTGESEHLQICVTRLDSIISLCKEANASMGGVVPVELIEIIEEASELLNSELLLDAPESKRCGRPMIHLPVQELEHLLSMNFSVPQMAIMFGVSRDTIFRRMRSAGLSVQDTYSRISDQELSDLVFSILTNLPNTGYKRMKGYLHVQGIRVTDQRVREVMRLVDPQGVYYRTTKRNRIIRRREYNVKYSNWIWHIDGNLKLIRWGFVIRSGIDGKSRTATYIKATCDNQSDTHLDAFLGAIQEYGIPLRTRSDKGGENILIARFMIDQRGVGKRSHICGRSVHNQRIERFWRDVSEGCTGRYRELFMQLEEDGVLDVDDEVQMYVLHRIFLPRLNWHLQMFRNGWNNHPISTENNFSPNQLMLKHMLPAEQDIFPVEIQDEQNGEYLCESHEDLELFEEAITQPIFRIPNLSEDQMNALNSIGCFDESNSFGYDIFVKALSGVKAVHEVTLRN